MKVEEMSRVELYAQLKRLKYEGPTSYRKEKLRELVLEVAEKPADHNFKSITKTKAGKETFGGPGRPAGGVEDREARLRETFEQIAYSFAVGHEDGIDPGLLRTLVRRGLVVRFEVFDGGREVPRWQLAQNAEEGQHASSAELDSWFAGNWALDAA